ncbi:MAG TPA: polyphosphate kinase 1 [Myxococcota bacterium]|nr:polyphosphate kinase 1 [Myxococcota bacterium]
MARRGRGQPERMPIVDRESSWIRFNLRVLEEAEDPQVPLLERLRFLTIFHTNLDEFFMIRVSGIKQQLVAGVQIAGDDGLSPRQRLARLGRDIRSSLERAEACLESLLAQLAGAGVSLVRFAELEPDVQARWNAFYVERVHPILTPLAISPVMPFPFISNLSRNLAVYVSSDDDERLVRIKVPDHLPRLLVVDEASDPTHPPMRLMTIEDLIAANLHQLFPGMEVDRAHPFRVTRDADVEIHEDEADDLLKFVEVELRKRRFGQPVRLEVDDDMPRRMISELQDGLGLDNTYTYAVTRMIDPTGLDRVLQLDLPQHKFKPFVPRVHKELTGPGVFQRLRQGDVLLHHPFDSFAPVAELVRQAARDPAVLAIKMTLYRTSGDSPVINALLDAVERGKQVAAVVELKARFDEKNNIEWARRLEEAGVHVIYGVPHLKTHAKLCLVVRREKDGLRRYVHIGTGNYNPVSARIYTDFGLFTTDPDITTDIAELFNQVTGFALPDRFRQVLVAPRFMKERLLALIRDEAVEARSGRPSGILLKCNALTDRQVIEALYEASRAGVPIELMVRGMCALVPGRKGWSETIRVRSVVGRFLEHTRVYWFEHGGDAEVLIGSADLMERNLDRRMEVLVPVRSPEIRRWLREVYLQRYLDDVGRSRRMNSDGDLLRERTELSCEPDVHQQFLRDLGRR